MKLSVPVTCVLVAIGIAIGFLAGRTTGGAGEGGTPDPKTEGPGRGAAGKSDRLGGGMENRDRRAGGRSPAATIRQAARELELSPMASMDFDAMFEFYDAIRWMTPDDIQIALAELEDGSTNPQIKMVMKMMLINHWAKQDGQGAVEYALKGEQVMEKSMGVMGGIMGWVKNDPEGAYAWFEENREGLSERGGMAGQMDGMILAALAQRDMGRAFEGLKGLGKQQQTMALAIMSSQMMVDPVKREQFVQQLEGLEDSDVRRQGLESMVQMWAFQDPQGAVAFVESREWEGATGNQMRDHLTSSWANTDARAALEWRLQNVGEDENRGEVIAGGFSQWVTQDPEGAQEWLRAQPAEVRSDPLFVMTASQLRFRDSFDEAASWGGQIQDQGTRESTLRDIYGAWRVENEGAAETWMNGLDETTRAAVQAGVATEAAPEIQRDPLEVAPTSR